MQYYAPRTSVWYLDCEFCGELRVVRSAQAKSCVDDACRRARHAKRMRDGGWMPAVDHRRRQRLAVAVTENVSPIEVYERDWWICGICHLPVDAQVRHPDPMCPSLDHVVPVSLGGAHTFDNLRLAHLICNIRRGNRVA